MNNADICIYLMNSLDEIIYVDYVPQLSLIYTDSEYNKKLSLFSIDVQ
jgi:hypothetical protein